MTNESALTAMLFGKDQGLLYDLAEGIREAAQALGAQTPRMAIATTDSDLTNALRSNEIWDMACVDIDHGSGMGSVYTIRSVAPSVELLLAVDANLSPMSYIKPGVMPTGLVQKPAGARAIQGALREFVAYVLEKRHKTSGAEVFSIQTKEGVTKIPLHSIVCFESRAKRIFVRQQRQEQCYYDTLDRLEKTLPPFFLRCHRSFIVNEQRVSRVLLARNQIEMDDGTTIPISRSYKAAVRERIL